MDDQTFGGNMSIKSKILLVDDEIFVLEQIRKNIDWESFGMKLIGCCENALDAIEQMIDEMPDILITDIKMPVMDGLDLIGKARQMNPSIQCVVLSGYAEFTLAQTAMEQGAVAYLLKPFLKEEFEKVLRQCSDRICKMRSARIRDMEQHMELVEKLIQELLLWKDNDEKIHADMLRGLMKDYPDLSLLRDAVLLLLVRQETEGRDNKEWILKIMESGEGIFELAANLLEEIWKEKVNESVLVRRIKEYTRQHYQEEGLNLQLLADQVVHLGVKYIGRCFRNETGCKYSEYLLQIRMEKAIEMLKSEDVTNEVIVEKIGLGHDASYFYQLFKKYTGKTPGEYRQEFYKNI